MVIFILLVMIPMVTSYGACPPWTLYNSTLDQCQCGSSLGGVVRCNKETLKVSVLKCYCMTFSTRAHQAVITKCLISCTNSKRDHDCGVYHHIVNTNDTTLINNKTCGLMKRTGQHCGKCVKDYGFPVYSYSTMCVKCKHSDMTRNALKYTAAAYLPLTIFYLIVIIFKVSVTSGPMVVYVLLSQAITTPYSLMAYNNPHKKPKIATEVFLTMFGIWNLDMFRSLYTPFCISTKMTALQVAALDYCVGIYPILLIVLTYITVCLHDRFSLVVKIWKPMSRICLYIRKEWNIRSSLVQAFTTFLVLSYVKILNTSFKILTPIRLQTAHGKYLNETYLYLDGEVLYFGEEHLPYGILAILMLLIFNILPTLLIFLYPCSYFRRCLNQCGLQEQVLYTFMDAFQGCYRHKPLDYRHFAAFYLFLRILILSTFFIIGDYTFLCILALISLTVAILIIFAKPQRVNILNQTDAALFLIYSMLYFLNVMKSYVEAYEPRPLHKHYISIFSTMEDLLLLIVFLYGSVYMILKVIPTNIQIKIKKCFYSSFDYCIRRKRDEISPDRRFLEESLPHRLEHYQEYTPLLQTE